MKKIYQIHHKNIESPQYPAGNSIGLFNNRMKVERYLKNYGIKANEGAYKNWNEDCDFYTIAINCDETIVISEYKMPAKRLSFEIYKDWFRKLKNKEHV